MAIGWIICASLGEFLCAKLEISFKTQENISKLAVRSEHRQIFQNLNGRFSLNFLDSYIYGYKTDNLCEFGQVSMRQT